MSTAKFEVTTEAVSAWCKKLHAEGIDLTMTWDGGGDSGWVTFEIDKAERTDEDSEFIAYLENRCYEELDYGSWAGEFSASGEATYDPEENAFVGTDYYSEDDSVSQDCLLRIAIPADVWFDSVEIMVQDEEIEVQVELIVRNGFKTEAHTAAEEALKLSIQHQVLEIVDEFCKHSEDEFRSMWEEINLSKDEFTLEGNEMVHVVDQISIGIYQSEERGIFINLETEE